MALLKDVIYRDRPSFATGVRQLYVAIPVFLIAIGAIPLFFPRGTTLHERLTFFAICLVMCISIGALFWFAMPREYRIMEDRLRITGGFYAKHDKLFMDIDSITHLDQTNTNQMGQILSYSRETMIYPYRNVIVIKTHDGKLTFLSPQDAKSFYEKLNTQIEIHKENVNSN